MSKQLKRQQSIMRLQESLRSISEAKLASLDRRIKKLNDDQSEIIRLLEQDFIGSGFLLDVSSRKLRVIDKDLAISAVERSDQSRRALDQAARAKAACNISARTKAETFERQRRDDLLDLIDRYQSNDPSSFE